MKPYIRLYLDYFGFATLDGEYIPCEVCRARAVDIHHIKARQKGGSKDKDFIENLMALCRSCHTKYGDKKKYLDLLTEQHEKVLSLGHEF